jgi:hypothetical protein
MQASSGQKPRIARRFDLEGFIYREGSIWRLEVQDLFWW